MRVVVFGATGMVGAGALRETLDAPEVESVLSIGRSPCGTLQAMPFRHAGSVRPGFIRPGPGIRSKTRGYQLGVVLLTPLFMFTPLLVRLFPFLFTTSEILGRAMLRVVEGRADRFILESADINRVGA